MARTYEETMARMAELEKAQSAQAAAPAPTTTTAVPAARAPAAPKPVVVPGMEALPKPSAAPPAPTVTRRAVSVTPKVEKVEPSKPVEIAPPPKPVVLTPDLAKPINYKQFYDNSAGLFSSALTLTASDFNMTEAELKRLAQAQGVDLEAIHRASTRGRTYEEIAAAGRERGVIGFMPLEEREKAFNKLATDVEKAQRGDAGDTIELVRSGADKGFGPAGALGGYTFAGTEAELPEVTKPGEHGYAVAQLLVDALQKDPSAVRTYDLYGRSLATGNTQRYIDDRVDDLRKRANIKASDADAMEKMAALRKRAINEVIAYKTVGQWTPIVTLGDVEVREGRASPGVLDALKPNIEIIGFNNKRQAIFRQESPMGVLFRVIDIPQAAIAGVLSGQTVGQGIQSGANLLEYSLDATKDSAMYVKAPVVAAGFAASILFPDALAAAGVAGKAIKAISEQRAALKIPPEALTLLETSARARKAGDYEAAAVAEKELRSLLPDVASNHDSTDAAVARFQKLAEPESDILDTDLAALIAGAAPEQAKVIAGRPFLHPSARKFVVGPSGLEQADYAELYDTRRQLDRVQRAKAEYVKTRTTGRSVTDYTKDYVRGRVHDVFENLPAERQLSLDQVKRMANIISAQAPAALLDQKQFKKAVEDALKADAEFGTDTYKMARQDAYKAIGGRTETKLDEIRGKTIEELEAADMGLFDRAIKAIEQNNTARGVAAQLLRDEIAKTARLRVEPLELFDEVAPKLQSGEPIRLTPGGLLLLHHLRKAFPKQDFKEAYATITIIDKMIEGAAQAREVSPMALYQEIFPLIKQGTPEDLKRLAGDLKAGKVPTGGAPTGGAPAAPAAPTKAARARAEAKLREMMRRMGDEELDEIEGLLRADGVQEGEAYALDAIKREKARRAREAKKAAAAAPAPVVDTERIAQLQDELEQAVESGDEFRQGELEMEIENLRRTAEPEAAPTTVVVEEVVETPAAAPVVEAPPPVAPSPAPAAAPTSAPSIRDINRADAAWMEAIRTFGENSEEAAAAFARRQDAFARAEAPAPTTAGPPTPAPIAAAAEAQPEAAKIVEAPAKRPRATRVKAEVAAPEVAPEVKPVVEAMAETEKKFAEAQKKSAADAVARAEAVEKARQEKNAKKLAELEAQRKIRDAEKQKRLEAYQAEQVRLAEEKAKKLAEREAKAKAKAEEAAKRLAERQAKEAKKEAFRLALEAQRREESRLFVEAAERADAEKARRAQEAAALRAAEEKRIAEEAARKMAQEAARKAAEEKRAAEEAFRAEQQRAEQAMRDAESQKRRAEIEEENRKREEKYSKLLAEALAENRERQAKMAAEAEERDRKFLAEAEERDRKFQADTEERNRKFRLAAEELDRKFRAAAEARAAEVAKAKEEAQRIKAEFESKRLAGEARLAEIEAERAARAAKQAEREAEAARAAAEEQRKAAAAREALRAERPQLADLEDRFPIARPANLKAVLREVRASTTNESYKRIIDRLLEQGGRFSNAEFRIVQAGDVVPSRVARSISNGASGTATTTFGGELVPHGVYIRGTSLGKIDFPLDEVILHEAIHAATVDQYEIGIRLGAKGTPTAAAAKAINELQGQVVRELKRRLETGGDLAGLSRGDIARMADDPSELIAYGLTNPQFQALLKTIKVESAKSAWTKFVEGVARLLGLAPGDESALSVLLERTERLLDLPPDELEATRRMVFPNSTPEATVSEMRSIADTAAYEEGKRFAAAEVERLIGEGQSRVGAAVRVRDTLPRRIDQMTDRERGIRDALSAPPSTKPRAARKAEAAPTTIRTAASAAFDALLEARARAKAEGFGMWDSKQPDYVLEAEKAYSYAKNGIPYTPKPRPSIEAEAPMPSGIPSDALRQVSPTGEVKGAVEWLEDGSSVIYLFEGADASTVLHEVAHVVRRNILSNEDMGFIASWVQGLGVNVGHQYGEFTGDAAEIEKAEELFAKAFEQYVAEGKAPAGLEGAFAQLKDAVANVYKAVKDPVIGVELQPEVRRVFDGLFATEPKQADLPLKEAIRRGILGGPEAEVDILTVLSREAKRKGLDQFSPDELVTRINEAKANIKQIAKRDPVGTDVVLKFDTKVMGKDKWTLDDLAAAQAARDARLAPQAEARMALQRDLTGKGRGKAAVYKEDTAVESLLTALSAKETDAPMTKQAKSVLRGVAAMYFGGNVMEETKLAGQPPALRRALATTGRIVEQSLADTTALVNDAVATGDDTQLLRYLTGDFNVAKVSGRPILSSGHDKMGAVNRMIQRAIAAFKDDEKEALIQLADAINTKDPAERGQKLTTLGFTADGGEVSFKEADEARKAMSDALRRAVGKLLYPEKQDADIGTSLAAALRDSVNAPEKARPSHELRLVETLTYLGGVTARDGDLFKGDSKDVVRTLLGDIRKIYGENGEESARRVAVQIGAFGGADQAKQFLVRMGLGVDENTQAAFARFLNGEQVGAENIEGVRRMLNTFGRDVNFVADAALDVDFYIPRAARERMAQVLSRAQFRTGDSVGAADALATSYRYMKTRMTRGNFFIRQRYFMMNTVDHFNAMAYTAGFGIAAASTARVVAQDLLVVPAMRELLEVGKATGVLSPVATERLRSSLQKLGDRAAGRIGEMMSVGKYRIEVNPILEGVDGGFTVGGKVYRYRDIRDIAVEEGVFSSFDTRELQRAILREGQLVLGGPAAKKATVQSRTTGAMLRDGLASLEESVADIAEAWGERERLGAMVTLMEAGYDPRTAAQITVKALFDYSQSMTKLDRHWLVGLLLPFWAFQKNANQQVFNMLFSPWGGYRMMVVKRARERTSDLLGNIMYNTLVDDYGVDVESMPPELQDSYYSTIKAFEEAFGPDGPTPEQKRAMRLLLSGRAIDVEGGALVEASAEIQRLRSAGAFADLARFIPFTVAEPSKASRSSVMRDRAGFPVPFPRSEGVRAYNALLGDNHSYMELYWPDSTIEAGMKWHTQVAATMFLLSAKGASSTGFTDLPDGGIDEVGWLSVIKPVVDAERSPVLGPLLAGEFTAPPPKRIAEIATPEAWMKVHPMLGKMLDDVYGTTFLRVPAVADPLLVDEDGNLPQLTPDQITEIQRLQEQYPDIGVLKKQRYYLPGGVWATAFENSPLGELNSLLLRWEEEPLESQGRKTIQGQILIWARKYAGVDVTLTAPSQAAKREEPRKKTETAGTKTF